jgi:hypothetical protein
MGFGPVWIRLIKQLTSGGSIGVEVNEVGSDFFLTGNGLRQGDPLSLRHLVCLTLWLMLSLKCSLRVVVLV